MSQQQYKPPDPLNEQEVFECDSGWLSPDAKLYASKHMHHHYFAKYISKQGTYGLENEGWIKLSPINGWLFFGDEMCEDPTEIQLQFIKDWCFENGKILPFWMRKPKPVIDDYEEDEETKEAKEYVRKLYEEAVKKENGK